MDTLEGRHNQLAAALLPSRAAQPGSGRSYPCRSCRMSRAAPVPFPRTAPRQPHHLATVLLHLAVTMPGCVQTVLRHLNHHLETTTPRLPAGKWYPSECRGNSLDDAQTASLLQHVHRFHMRTSLIVTTNLPFENWTEIMGCERLTGALLDRLTHRIHILEANDESYRLRESKQRLKTQAPKQPKQPEEGRETTSGGVHSG